MEEIKNMSEYYEGLDAPSKKRYLDKIEVISSVDPYTLTDTDFVMTLDKYPSISYPDIVNYLVFGTSPFTAEHLKAYKGLEAYNHVLEGWVRDIKVKSFGDKRLVTGKVRSITFSKNELKILRDLLRI